MGLFIGSVMNVVLFFMSWDVMESRIAFNMLPSVLMRSNFITIHILLKTIGNLCLIV